MSDTILILIPDQIIKGVIEANKNHYYAGAMSEYRKVGTCVWTHDDDTEMYDTGCGTTFYFNEGDLLDNNCHFCHKCGGKIEEQDDE